MPSLVRSLPRAARLTARRHLARLIPTISVAPLVGEHTYLSEQKLVNLERLVKQASDEPILGSFVECGVAAGGSAALLAVWAHRLNRPLVLFDTFEGLPAPTIDDPDYEQALAWTGKCLGTTEQVRELLAEFAPQADVTLVKGLFQDTLPTWSGGPVAVLHLDGDWYESTKTCLAYLWDRVSPGGFVQFDDYHTWQGCKRAVNEFFAERRIPTSGLREIDGHGVWIRKPS